MALGVQRSFEDLGAALVDTAFVVFDLETTGGSPATCGITEIGAVKVRGGEVVGEFQTLVDPGMPIPAPIVALTGITDAMVASAEPIARVLPSFLEFIGDATLVAHNASFDTRFLQANCARDAYPLPRNPVVCTVRLARRLVRDEVPNLQLSTLAYALRARTTPTHRALDDARATTDVFHALLERCGRLGVTHLDDLLWFQSARGHPSYQKVKLVEHLPRARGVYIFRNAHGRALYVGKATDLRTRVRSYFGGDERKRIDDLLREMSGVDHLLCATDLDASVLEARLIRKHKPPFNRAQRGRGASYFVRLTDERFPRLSVAKSAQGFGPLTSRAAAGLREALEDATDIRTCNQRIGRTTRAPSCVRGQIGRCPSPCDRDVDPAAYADIAEPVVQALKGDPSRVLMALSERIARLAEQQRFEEAAVARDRLGTIVAAVRSIRAVTALQRAGAFTIAVDGHRLRCENGRLEGVDGKALACDPDGHPDEPRLIASWIARNQQRVTLESCSGELAQPVDGGSAIAAWTTALKRAGEQVRAG